MNCSKAFNTSLHYKSVQTNGVILLEKSTKIDLTLKLTKLDLTLKLT